MNSVIFTKIYNEPAFNKKEILRYAGCKQETTEISDIIDSCILEIKNKLTYKVCYRVLPVKLKNNICDFGVFKADSKQLAINLKNADTVIIFAATVGLEADRLIAKYGRISPLKALIFQAIAAERIEALCNEFCFDIERQYKKTLTKRFSPGYADLSLNVQKDIFSILECEKKIGLTLNNSLLMSPSKSVTAFVGFELD